MEDRDGRGWGAPWGGWFERGDVGEVRERLETGAANDSDGHRVCHMSAVRALEGWLRDACRCSGLPRWPFCESRCGCCCW